MWRVEKVNRSESSGPGAKPEQLEERKGEQRKHNTAKQTCSPSLSQSASYLIWANMRRACKYLLMNNIYFVIKVVDGGVPVAREKKEEGKRGEGIEGNCSTPLPCMPWTTSGSSSACFRASPRDTHRVWALAAC